MLKQKNERKKAKVREYRERLGYKDREIEKKETVIRGLAEGKEEAERRLKKVQLKMRQIEVTRIKDMQKKISE